MTGRPNLDQRDIDRILAALGHGRWVKGKHLAAAARVPARKIRAAAEQTGQIISGQRGYKLTEAASEAEIYASYADLMSRAAHIRARAERLNQALEGRQLGLPL